MSEDTKCSRANWPIFGCKFEGRYDLGDPDPNLAWNVASITVGGPERAEVIRACSPRTYVCDICVRCGKAVTREPR